MNYFPKETNNNAFENILLTALKMPGVKVNRSDFLTSTLVSKVKDPSIISQAIDTSPIAAGIPISHLNKIAKSLINSRTIQSSGLSFASGLPGGLAMAATIPADTLQFFGTALKLAQELAYLYNYEDFWHDDDLDNDKVKRIFTLFLGVMFGVGGSASALKVFSANFSQHVFRTTSRKALTKTAYYPIIKKIGAALGIKVTKNSFAKGLSKTVPIIGGVVSGGLTYTSMKSMAGKLNNVLIESAENYTARDYEKDLDILNL